MKIFSKTQIIFINFIYVSPLITIENLSHRLVVNFKITSIENKTKPVTSEKSSFV